jgi:hypothetical protein
VLRPLWLRIRKHTTPQALWSLLVRPVTLTVIVAILLGATTGQLLASAGNDDQVVVGNTGGTLSSIIRVDKELIVFGGGNARSDLADLLGRSTLPWKRQVDLLIIPGWDSEQAVGALGLLERQDVKQVVILGQPSTTTIWTVLYQTASSHAVPVNIANQQSRIEISPDVRLELAAADVQPGETTAFALVTLQYHAVRLSFLDVSKDGVNAFNSANVAPARTHALMVSRAASGLRTSATLRVQPASSQAGDFDLVSSSYQRELGRGERITIGLASDELRLDLNAVKRTGGTTPQATPASG